MKKQNNQEPNNQQSLIEDLTVNEDTAEEVKGGGWGSSSYQYAFAGTYYNS